MYLQGVKAAIVRADQTFHQVLSLWCRSSSTTALGNSLSSVSRSGFVFFFLREFLNHCRYLSSIGENENGNENEMKMHPPYSLVNLAFSVAVCKVIGG